MIKFRFNIIFVSFYLSHIHLFMKSFYTIILFIIFFNFLNLHAQENAKADRLIQAANNALQMKDYEGFKTKINEAITQFPNYEPIYMVKTKFEMDSRQFQKALETQLKLYEFNDHFNPLQSKLLAECYFYLGDYMNAKKYAKEFLNTPGTSANNVSFCKRLIASADFAMSQPKSDPIPFENLGTQINSNHDEYFPSTSADERFLYFTRNTSGNEDIFVSEQLNGSWIPAVRIDMPDMNDDGTFNSINTSHNDGAHTISPDGKYLFFTSCGRPKSFGSCDLFFVSKSGGIWNRPKLLPKPINTISWESQPCASNDGSEIYFVSSRPGGIGGIDIYVTQVSEKGVFSEPQNLGEIINTPYDEDKPFLHPDGQTLYFSSNGHPGYGGKDLFMSKKVEGVWQKPINLGNAINTLGDEVSIFVNTIGNKAYLARNAESGPGRNNLDLFSFELPKSYRPEKATYMKGLVIHKLTKKPLSAQVKVFDPTASKTIATVQSDSKNGEFLFPISLVSSMYGFNVNKQGFALYSKNIEIQKNNSNAQNLVIEMMPLEKGTKFELRNVFFETAKFDLKSSSKTELDIVVNMLKQHPDLNILISGHTDNVGQESNNKLLSENRAKSVMNFLIKAGVESNRLQYKGFGSLQPLQPNTTPEGRAINRRTEIEIM